MELIARLLPGALLAIAGGLKISEWAAGTQEGWAAHPALSSAEIVLGAWLLSGVRPDWSKRVAAGCFIVFAGWSVALFASGADSCGCFGRVKAAPHLTFLLDIYMVLLLVAGMRRESAPVRGTEDGGWGRRRKWVAATVVFCATAAAFVGWNLQSPHPSTRQQIRAGQPWPKGIAHVPEETSRGQWIFLVYDPACHRCLSLAEEYEELARAWKGKPGKPRIAFIEAAGYPSSEKPGDAAGLAQGELIDSKTYGHAPLMAFVKNGVVEHTRESWTMPDWSRPPFASWFGNLNPAKP